MTERIAPPAAPASTIWSKDESPFHRGEIAVQERTGMRAKIEQQARFLLHQALPEQHRAFFAQLPFLVLGGLDGGGRVWATILAGRPGFITSPDPATLAIRAPLSAGDPLAEAAVAGAPLGFLGIELPTRRRNRMSGRLAMADAGGLLVTVDQCYGNCPQYIQTREPRFVAPADDGAVGSSAAMLDGSDCELIAAADTFFIASANLHPDAGGGRGVDVSHRGGKPGFVRIDDQRTLTTPDFVGNFVFNTLGNLVVDPAAGLLFVDWSTGGLLHLTGEAEIVWEGPEVRAFAGAQRLVRFHIHEVRRRPGALPLRFSAPGYSPRLAGTGDWPRAARATPTGRPLIDPA